MNLSTLVSIGQLHQIATDFYDIKLNIEELNSEPFINENSKFWPDI